MKLLPYILIVCSIVSKLIAQKLDNASSIYDEIERLKTQVIRLEKTINKCKNNKIPKVIHMIPNSVKYGNKFTTGNIFNGTRLLNFWITDKWNTTKYSKGYYSLDEEEGRVVILKNGLYLVSVQVLYHDLGGRYSMQLFVNTIQKATCIATEQLHDGRKYDLISHGVYHQCTIITVLYLKQYDQIYLYCPYGSKQYMTKEDFSHFSIILL